MSSLPRSELALLCAQSFRGMLCFPSNLLRPNLSSALRKKSGSRPSTKQQKKQADRFSRMLNLGQTAMYNSFHHEALGYAREVKDKKLTAFFTTRLVDIKVQIDANRSSLCLILKNPGNEGRRACHRAAASSAENHTTDRSLPLQGRTRDSIAIQRSFDCDHAPKLLILMVAGDGIEPPTRGFSIPCSTN